MTIGKSKNPNKGYQRQWMEISQYQSRTIENLKFFSQRFQMEKLDFEKLKKVLGIFF